MNQTNLINATEQLFIRSCLETAPDGGYFGRAAIRGAGVRRGSMRLHQLKQKLLQAALAATGQPQAHKQLCGSANTAAELVWDTEFPLLLYPCLFEELAHGVRERFAEYPPTDGSFVLAQTIPTR